MISVIIPVYNGENHIHKIHQSFLNQNYKDFELIFIDDGSIDDSINILKILAEHTPLNMSWVSQPNGGVSAARNTGIEKAKGEFVCFCDVDDTVYSTYLKEMLAWFRYDQDIELVMANIEMIKDGHRIVREFSGDTKIMSPEIALQQYFDRKMPTSGCSMMVKKTLLSTYDLRFKTGYKYGEDLHMIWRLLGLAKKIAYIDQPLYIYYLHADSAMSVFSEDRFHAYDLMVQLQTFFKSYHPKFAKTFEKYVANQMIWSLTWQWSIQLPYFDFQQFVQKYQIKQNIRPLMTMKDLKISLSSILFILSPRLFRRFAIIFGKKYTQ